MVSSSNYYGNDNSSVTATENMSHGMARNMTKSNLGIESSNMAATLDAAKQGTK